MTILVAEDDHAALALLTRVLAANGYSVLEARDGREALQAAQDPRVRRLLTDVIMPHLNGVALGHLLAAQRPELHIVYMAGYLERLLGVPLDARVLGKPVTPSLVLSTVQAVLRACYQHHC